jgi:hypothetical protein
MDKKLLDAYRKAKQLDDQEYEGQEAQTYEDVGGFLDVISQIESSGGKNLNHPMMKSGMHKGHTAMGKYGLMPNTVTEVATRMERDGTITPEIKALAQMSPEQMKQAIEENTDYEEQLARYLGTHILKRQEGDLEKAAYSWNQGHNLTPDKIDQREYKESDYVKKYKRIRDMLGGMKK